MKMIPSALSLAFVFAALPSPLPGSQAGSLGSSDPAWVAAEVDRMAELERELSKNYEETDWDAALRTVEAMIELVGDDPEATKPQDTR